MGSGIYDQLACYPPGYSNSIVKKGILNCPIDYRVPYWVSSLPLACFTCESIENCRFVSDDPAVMSWWNVGYISWAVFDFLAIVRFHPHPTWDPDSEMVHFTGICFSNGFDVFWPLPSRLIRLLQHCHVTYCDGVYPWKRRYLGRIRFLKILF